MTTVQTVFDMAIHMMDEQSESSGATLNTDTKEYTFRTISILNAVMQSLYPYSDTKLPGAEGMRSPCPLLIAPKGKEQPDFTQIIPIDDVLAIGVLPYALASHLLASENEELSAWFQAKYDRASRDLQNKIPQSFEPIEPAYGLF